MSCQLLNHVTFLFSFLRFLFTNILFIWFWLCQLSWALPGVRASLWLWPWGSRAGGLSSRGVWAQPPLGTRGLSSLIRDWTCVPCTLSVGRQTPNHWTTWGVSLVFVFLLSLVFWNFLAFSMIRWMLAVWSLVPLPFLNPACSSVSSRFTYCWGLAWRISSMTVLVCEMSAVGWQFEHFWHCSSFGLEWKLTFPSPVGTAEFSRFAGILNAALLQHHLLESEIAQLEFHHLH